MKKSIYIIGLLMLFSTLNLTAQEKNKIDYWEIQKEKIRKQEKDSLKMTIEKINKKLDEKEISFDEAEILKTQAKKKADLKIESRISDINKRMDRLKKYGLEIIVKNKDTIIRGRSNVEYNIQFDTYLKNREKIKISENKLLETEIKAIDNDLKLKRINRKEAKNLKEKATIKTEQKISEKLEQLSLKLQLPYNIKLLEDEKNKIVIQEKQVLKNKVKRINKKLSDNEITLEEAKKLKEAAAKKHALNIENRIAIIDNKIALLKRNNDSGTLVESIIDHEQGGSVLIIGFGDKVNDNNTLFGVNIHNRSPKKIKYDRRTKADLIVAVGLNNALIDNQSLDDTPYKIGGSRFFEFGWQWQTRVFKNSNFLRFNYGLSFQFNGLKPKDNQYFVANGNQTELQEFQYNLKKAKLRMDNLVFPVHLEFGPSKVRKTEHSIRYSTYRKFKFGVGGYAGFNLGTRQKLKYKMDGKKVKDKIKREYNTPNFVYGISTYAGFGDTTLYLKYDLSPIFKDALVEQHNISLGLRFHL